jgi:dUTP pyrophosphatase
MITIMVQFCWVDPDGCRDLELPRYHTDHASGMDIVAALKADVVLQPGQIRLLPTGFAVAIPEGFELQVRPRSGLAVKHGVTVVNSPGTIDSDYRGEILVGLINLGDKAFSIRRGDRIAQLVLAPVVQARFDVVSQLDTTIRGAGGFGHTGK